jgi:predicted PhzF superfamily epimerase YddE/YHI9
LSIQTINARNGFQGIWPAMLTPLDAQLHIDHAALAAHAQALINAGCGGVTVFGTTGEGPSFSVAERKQAIEQLIARGIAADRIMVSTSCAALADTLELTRQAVALGVPLPLCSCGVIPAGVSLKAEGASDGAAVEPASVPWPASNWQMTPAPATHGLEGPPSHPYLRESRLPREMPPVLIR